MRYNQEILNNMIALEIERGSTKSHSMDNSFWTRLWTCPNIDYRMNEFLIACVYFPVMQRATRKNKKSITAHKCDVRTRICRQCIVMSQPNKYVFSLSFSGACNYILHGIIFGTKNAFVIKEVFWYFLQCLSENYLEHRTTYLQKCSHKFLLVSMRHACHFVRF